MTPPHPIPTLFPTRRSSDLLLALVIAVSAASPRNRPIQNALTEPLSDCSTFAPRIGSANSSRVGAIGPSVRSRVRVGGERGFTLDRGLEANGRRQSAVAYCLFMLQSPE